MPSKARRRRRAAAQLSPTATRLSIGECRVDIPHSLSYEQTKDSISIKVPHSGCITIAGTGSNRYTTRSIKDNEIFRQDSQGLMLLKGLSVVLLNPKSLDNEGHLLLKAALTLYSMELPEMSFAANTRKESPFLEKCVTSGKYCTLLLRRTMLDTDEVLAALSYQILPPDTQYAEIPLAAVRKDCQHKGIGLFLFNELRRRLQDVGVLTIFCWGDQESGGFWLKQGFIKVAEVDGHGKPHKLPIKPDVRRAMSIPGSATLLVSHMYCKPAITVASDSNKFATTPPRQVQPHVAEGLYETAPPALKSSPAAAITTPTVGELKPSLQVTPLLAQCEQLVKASGMTPLNIDGAFSSVATRIEVKRSAAPFEGDLHSCIPMEQVLPLTLAPPSQPMIATVGSLPCEGIQGELAERVIQNHEGEAGKQATLTPPQLDKENIYAKSVQRGRKRARPGASQAQWLEKQKKALNCSQGSKKLHSEVMMPQQHGVLNELPEPNVVLAELPTKPLATVACVNADKETQQDLQGGATANSQLMKLTIMFMNMANDNSRRLQLTKFVERLGGKVTNDGNQCTHVVTGEARRTLNFCNALNTGAWVVSPAWLKASVKEKKFTEEVPFVLKDEAFECKYKTTLENVIKRGKQRPHGLLQGLCIYPTKHVQPPLEMLSAIILSAGGKVLSSLEEAKGSSGAIVVACEDDISEALMAAKAGLPTYSSEWLMCCIMKQELDMTTTQFTESL